MQTNKVPLNGLSFFFFVLFGLALMSRTAMARLYDDFNNSTNWTLSQSGGGMSVISNSVLTLSVPANTIAKESATLNSAQVVTGTRQSILVRAHTGVANETVFFFWAMDTATGNMLEIKINDQATTTLTCGYYDDGGATYHYVGTTDYVIGNTDGVYLAYKESGGTTYWEMSTNDAYTWTDITSMADPISTSSMIFVLQHKAMDDTTSPTGTTVDCLNYRANGVGYHDIQDTTNSGTGYWELYTECFTNNVYECQNSCEDTEIFVNDVTSPDHFTDSTIPLPRYDDTGDHFEIISNNMLCWKNGDCGYPGATDLYCNTMRFQNLPFVDADTWTYHLYFKYAYPDTIQQGLEFPINKYTGTNRLQGAVAWYPNRPDTGTHEGLWDVYDQSTSKWVATTNYEVLQTNVWNEVLFTVGLHDDNIYYSNFQAGPAGNMTNYVWNVTYAGKAESQTAYITPGMQMDDNVSDTTLAGTRKDVYLAEWNIDWQDEELPATP